MLYLLRLRMLLALLILATPAQAWQFTSGQPCLLTHETAEAQIVLTYDPVQPLYSLTITRAEPWPEAPAFHMRFDGPQGLIIGTDRHTFSEDRRSLTATDRGFGNVLDGLQYNRSAHALAGGITVSFALDGASGPVAAFRACEPALPLS